MRYIYIFLNTGYVFVMAVTFERKMKLAKFLHKEKMIAEKKSKNGDKRDWQI